MSRSYSGIIEFARENSGKLINNMKVKLSSEFIAKINNVNFDEKVELDKLKIEERALSRCEELIENVLEILERS